MRKTKTIKKCWVCNADLPHLKAVPACKASHYKLFIRSKTGDNLRDLLRRRPQLVEFL